MRASEHLKKYVKKFKKMLDKWKEWKKDTNPTHAHIWEPIFGKHHESMVRSGSYRSSIGEDIFDNEYEWEGLSGESEECRNCLLYTSDAADD